MKFLIILNLTAFAAAVPTLLSSIVGEGQIVKGVGNKITRADDVEVGAKLPSIQVNLDAGEIALIQSLFLMSFQRNGPADVRDVRYWLGNVITLSESIGLHRSSCSVSKTVETPTMRRRIWWSIYVRERQSAASLGLPSRIRDEDCDIEPLSAADLEAPDVNLEHPILAPTKPEHITYAIKMVEVSRLIGRIIDLHFVPGRTGSKAKDVESLDNALEAWKDSLPQSMRFYR